MKNNEDKIIYLDNTATSRPKPPAVMQAMTCFLEKVCANPGRSGHRLSVEAGRVVYEAREAVAGFLGASDPLRVVFGHNVTEALNLALKALLKPGDHVVTTSMEHNSMMRPLRALEREGVEVTVVSCSPEGFLDPVDVESALRPRTAMIAMNHASNVVGTLLPVKEVGALAKRHGALLLVDAAQTAGAYPIDIQAEDIDLLGFTGHKALLGPMGTGGLVIGDRVDERRMRPIKQGGTGSRSEHEEHPDFLPDLCESGTPNAVGLAGLTAGINWILDQGVDRIRDREVDLTGRLMEGLTEMKGITLYGGHDPSQRTATVAFNIEGLSPSEVALKLDEDHSIMSRPGLHCSPASHKTLGTFPVGSVRFGIGAFTRAEELDRALLAVARIAREVP